MSKAILLLLSVNIVLINCASLEKSWHHPIQQEITQPIAGGEVMGGHEQLRSPVPPIVTEENVIAEQQGVNPISYLPPFIQGLLPSVVSQTIAQLASYIPGFQRTGLYPNVGLGNAAGLGYNPIVVINPGYPANLGGIYGQRGYLPGQLGQLAGQLGYLYGQPEYYGGRQMYLQGQHGYYPEWLSGLSPYGRYRRETVS